MTIYARSDLMSVAISPEHGGCGEVHSRPVREGAPDKIWSLTCHGGCEDVLRSDPHWSGHPDDVPETPDEKMVRESNQRAGQKQRENSTHDAIAELSKLGDLPKAIEQLAKIMSGDKGSDTPPEMDACPNDHMVPTGVKFCPECGASMTAKESEPDDGSSGGDNTPAPDEDKKPAEPVKRAPAKKAPARKPADG